MFFSDLHVQLLSRGILNPGEQLRGQTVTGYMPWWAFGFIRRQYLVLATDQRLILVDHRFSVLRPTTQRLHAVDSLAWANVREAKVTGLLLKKKLVVSGHGDHGPISLKMVISNAFFGLLAPMKNNMQGARAIAAAAQSMRPSSGAPALAAAPQPYSLPPAPYPQQAPQVQAAYSQPPVAYSAPPMPPINAPGYHSVPPAAPAQLNQYGVPRPPAPPPFAPPRRY